MTFNVLQSTILIRIQRNTEKNLISSIMFIVPVLIKFVFLVHVCASFHLAIKQRKARLQLEDMVKSERSRYLSNIMKKVVGLSFVVLTATIIPVKRARSISEGTLLIDLLARVMESQAIMLPTKEFVEQQAYDTARYNIQFILNQLQLQKTVTKLMRSALEVIDDETLQEKVEDAGARITNTAIQYDSTVYTCVFIPTVNGEVPPSAEKYRKQAEGYYEQFMADAYTLLTAGSAEQLAAARILAAQRLATYPKVLFKETTTKN